MLQSLLSCSAEWGCPPQIQCDYWDGILPSKANADGTSQTVFRLPAFSPDGCPVVTTTLLWIQSTGSVQIQDAAWQ